MGVLRNITAECTMTNNFGEEYTAHILIKEASTDGITTNRLESGEYQHKLILQPSEYEITIFDELKGNDNGKLYYEPIHWSIK